MDFKRFGRYNSKKLDTFLDEHNPLYSMGRIFPISSTRKTSMDNRHTIASFKTMCKTYRYCYRLHEESCIAQKKSKGIEGYEDCYEIENDLYVFTNIAYNDIDIIDCELVYYRDEIIRIEESYEIESVLEDMRLRKISKTQLDDLKKLLRGIQFLPLKFEDIPIEFKSTISKSLFDEFRWRILLFDTEIYNSNKEDIESTQIKRVKIEQGYSILNDIQRYYPLDSLLSDIEKYKGYFEEFNTYANQKMKYSSKELAARLREDPKLEELFKYVNEYGTLKPIFEEKLNDYKKILKNYNFLNDPYSKEYREFFNRYKKILSLWQTQQVMRKYKSEYTLVIDTIQQLEKRLKEIEAYSEILYDIDTTYQNDLGDNSIANDGFGYEGDGWYDDVDDPDELDAMGQIRAETQAQIEMEKDEYHRQLQKEAEEEEYFEEFEEQQYQKYLNEQYLIRFDELIDFTKDILKVDLEANPEILDILHSVAMEEIYDDQPNFR